VTGEGVGKVGNEAGWEGGGGMGRSNRERAVGGVVEMARRGGARCGRQK